jgi:hypothetical protein
MVRRKRLTANEMIRAGGFRNFRTALRHAARYGQACELEGKFLTLMEYQEFTGLGRAQVFREQAAWRACCGKVSVGEVVSSEALTRRGLTEADREAFIAEELAAD